MKYPILAAKNKQIPVPILSLLYYLIYLNCKFLPVQFWPAEQYLIAIPPSHDKIIKLERKSRMRLEGSVISLYE
jgi:hypothetical protein